jgi:hypothetical protein
MHDRVMQAKHKSNIAGIKNPERKAVCFIVPSLIKRLILAAHHSINKPAGMGFIDSGLDYAAKNTGGRRI